jgi:hypothetical protein
VFLFVQGFFAWIFIGEGEDTSTIACLTNVTAVIALAGCSMPWWRRWLAGVLLIISWSTYSGWFIYQIATLPENRLPTVHLAARSYYLDYLVPGLPLLLAGVLFYCLGGF